MEQILQWGIEVVLFFQSLGTWLAVPMKFLSFLASEGLFLLLLPVLYWCVDPGAGLRMGILLMLSGSINTFFKMLFHQPRPYWIDTRVQAYATESSFGLPSGHSQNSLAVYGGLASWYKKSWGWTAALLLSFLIGISRIYLGVHFPTDLLAGWAIGAVILWAYLKLEPAVQTQMKKLQPVIQIGIALAASLAIILLGVAAKVTLRDWQLPPEWIANAHAAAPEAELINPTDLTGLFSNSAAFFGLCLGVILLARRGGYQAKGEARQLVLRYILGIIGALVLWGGLRVIFPQGEDWLSLGLRYVRYAALGFWVTGGAPWLFYRLGLAKEKANPGTYLPGGAG
jgi:membrane-associated phospholipid phosphatase